MSRVSVPFTGDTTQRRVQPSLSDRQLGLVARLAESCGTWEEQRGEQEVEEEGRRGQGGRREFIAGRSNSMIEEDLRREASSREKSGDRAMASFRQKLPCYKMREELLEAIRKNQVIVVSGETGCGKTTQVGSSCGSVTCYVNILPPGASIYPGRRYQAGPGLLRQLSVHPASPSGRHLGGRARGQGTRGAAGQVRGFPGEDGAQAAPGPGLRPVLHRRHPAPADGFRQTA